MELRGDILTRIDDLRARAIAGGERLLQGEVEELLSEGYIEALTCEARSRSLTQQLEALMEALDAPGASGRVRELARERRHVDQHVRLLRLRLGEMRDVAWRPAGPTALNG